MSVQKRGKTIKLKGTYSEIKLRPLAELLPYDKNPKKHPQEQIEKIAESIKSFGFDQPIVIDENNVIIKGHGRRLASQFLGLVQVPTIKRTDMSAAQVRASRIADNQTAEAYWDMSNLIYELETLYGMGGKDSLEATGYDEEEIKTILPGLLDEASDYQAQVIEGVIPIELSMTSPDGLVGVNIKSKGTLAKWVAGHKKIIILFNGNRTDLAALCWVQKNDLPADKLEIHDFTFGQRMWKWHDEYLDYVENQLNIKIIRSHRTQTNEFYASIKDKGYPTDEKPWCCNVYKTKALNAVIGEAKSKDCVLIIGATKTEEGEQLFRQQGKLINSELHYAAPFATGVDADLTDMIANFDLKLNPVYKKLEQYLCPGCPLYKSPDYVMMKNLDLDLWIRWMVIIGRAQYNNTQLQDDTLNNQLLQMIGDGIDAKQHGTYEDLAADLPNCVQPARETIRVGDEYGWNEVDDAKLSKSGELDAPRDNWFEHEEYGIPYNRLLAECAAVKADVAEKGYDAHMENTIQKAKEEAAKQEADEDNNVDPEQSEETS